MKLILDLNGIEYKDVIESVEYHAEDIKGDLLIRIYFTGDIPAKDSGWDEVVRTATKDTSSGMSCKVFCIDEEDRIVRQYEINKVYFSEYTECYDTPDGKAKFNLILNRKRLNWDNSEMADVMAFTEEDF